MQTKYIAAWELLNEKHPLLSTKSPHDDNAYTFDRIGNHNVVIAYLSIEKYDIALAASVTKNMLRSFESIRIELIIGIEGEAPSDKHNIRLGDIVIGYPIKKEDSVIPYNFGKAVQDREFE